MHVPHHQSEEYNYSVASDRERSSWGRVVSFAVGCWFAYLVLSMRGHQHHFGFLCTHGASIKWDPSKESSTRRPPIEFTMPQTPITSTKIMPGCLLYDRFFGTYVPETTPPTFGTVMPLASWNPLWANVSDSQNQCAVQRQRTLGLGDCSCLRQPISSMGLFRGVWP